jgi:hypothetical protein
MNYTISYFPAHTPRPVDHSFAANTDDAAREYAARWMERHRPFTRLVVVLAQRNDAVIAHFHQKLKLRVTISTELEAEVRESLVDADAADISAIINNSLRYAKPPLSLHIEAI